MKINTILLLILIRRILNLIYKQQLVFMFHVHVPMLIKEHRQQTNDNKLSIIKLSNITSSRRMISAIHNLHEWSQHRSLLKPMIDDIYFQLPDRL